MLQPHTSAKVNGSVASLLMVFVPRDGSVQSRVEEKCHGRVQLIQNAPLRMKLVPVIYVFPLVCVFRRVLTQPKTRRRRRDRYWGRCGGTRHRPTRRSVLQLRSHAERSHLDLRTGRTTRGAWHPLPPGPPERHGAAVWHVLLVERGSWARVALADAPEFCRVRREPTDLQRPGEPRRGCVLVVGFSVILADKLQRSDYRAQHAASKSRTGAPGRLLADLLRGLGAELSRSTLRLPTSRPPSSPEACVELVRAWLRGACVRPSGWGAI